MISRFEGFDQSLLFDKIEGRKILVCGSGPSIKRVNFDLLDYDYIITCNNFFKYDPLFNNHKIIFTAICPVCKFDHPRFKTYLSTHEELFIGSEENNNPLFKQKGFLRLKKSNQHRYVNFWTEHHKVGPCVGIGGRLLYFALHFNPSTLYFVGVDGCSPNVSNDPINAFRPEIGQVHTSSSSRACCQYKTLRDSHLSMCEVIHKKSQEINCKLFNLGEGLDYNISSHYSSQHFPLPEDIKKILS